MGILQSQTEEAVTLLACHLLNVYGLSCYEPLCPHLKDEDNYYVLQNCHEIEI